MHPALQAQVLIRQCVIFGRNSTEHFGKPIYQSYEIIYYKIFEKLSWKGEKFYVYYRMIQAGSITIKNTA